MTSEPGEQRVIVIGGSMAGLLAARVLSDFFPRVTVLERDSLPTDPIARKGVPQGRHAHALLGKGRAILETFFPGLGDALIAQGAASGSGRFFSGGGYFVKNEAIPPALYVSRPCLEREVRQRVVALPNVEIIDGCDVLGLLGGATQDRVTGVRILRRQPGAAEELLAAALTIDASGRGSRIGAWLEGMGYPQPEVELVEVGMGYASRFYPRRPGDLDGDLMVNVSPTPDNKRACGMLAQEGDRWIVTLAGYFGDYPPTDDAGYLDFARRLPTQDVYNLISSRQPLTEAVAFKFPANQRRRFERLERFPAGLLVIGDALCSFTPIYGQGMSVAAMETVVLRDALAEKGLADDLFAAYFRQVAHIIDTPWQITVGNDMRLSPGPDRRPRFLRFLHWYLGKLQIGARTDPALTYAFQRVGNLFDPPPSLLKPTVVWRVIRATLLRPKRAASGQATGLSNSQLIWTSQKKKQATK